MANNLQAQAANMTADLVNDFRNGGLMDQAMKGAGSDWNARYFSLYGDTYSTLLQNELSKQAWQANNVYNSPANQMKRLLDAGLNPNLAYNLATSGNSSSPADVTSKISGSAAAQAGTSAKQAQTQRIAQAFGAISQSIQMFQQVLGLAQGVQQYKSNQLQLDFDKLVAASYLNDTGTGAKTIYKDDTGQPWSVTPPEILYFGHFGKGQGLLPTLNALLNGESLRDLQGTQATINRYNHEFLQPWQAKLLKQDWEITDVNQQMLNYQNEMLNLLPPELRGIYNLIIAPLIGNLRFSWQHKSNTKTFNHNYSGF